MRNDEKRQPVVIELHVEAFGGSQDETFEVDRDEWDAMTPEKRAELAQELADDFAANHAAWGWNITDPDDYAAATEQGGADTRPYAASGGESGE